MSGEALLEMLVGAVNQVLDHLARHTYATEFYQFDATVDLLTLFHSMAGSPVPIPNAV